MSRASKITLAVTSLSTAGIIAFVHWSQQAEQSALHGGVVRDVQEQERKRQVRLERKADFEAQKALEAEYRKLQTVPDEKGDSNSSTRQGET